MSVGREYSDMWKQIAGIYSNARYMQVAEITLGRLYLGPAYLSEKLKEAGTKYIINLSRQRCPCRRRHYPIDIRETTPKRLLKAVKIIHYRIEEGAKSLCSVDAAPSLPY